MLNHTWGSSLRQRSQQVSANLCRRWLGSVLYVVWCNCLSAQVHMNACVGARKNNFSPKRVCVVFPSSNNGCPRNKCNTCVITWSTSYINFIAGSMMRCYTLLGLWLATSAYIHASSAASWHRRRSSEESASEPYDLDWFTSPITDWGTSSDSAEDPVAWTQVRGSDVERQMDAEDTDPETAGAANHFSVRASHVGNPITNRFV